MHTRSRFVPAALVISAMFHVGPLAPPAAGVPAQPQGGAPMSPTPLAPEAMDALLAPIALYPDPLVLQIVQCAGSPFQVREVDQWLQANQDVRGSAAQDAAMQQGFDDIFVAIVLFPDVVRMMAQKTDWTRQIGQAFETDRAGMLDSVQRLRAKAQSLGNLASNEQLDVQTVQTGDTQVIVIQPANPQVVYVPVYDPQVIYVQQAPPPPPPSSGGASGGHATAAGLIGFAAGVIVGAAADDIHVSYHYNCGGWGYRGPIMCNEGWNDYYDHRENMASDYYDHRENMAGQRGDNQAERRDTTSQIQGQRQTTRQENQSGRQGAVSQNQSQRQGSRGAAQSDRTAAAQRGTVAPASQNRSGAFSGYQRGQTERVSSSRGQRSASRSAGGGGGRRR